MKNYNEKTEELLVELARQDEMKNRKIIVITAISSIVCVLAYLAVVIIAGYALGEGTTYSVIVAISTVVFIVSLLAISKFEFETGYHVCEHCHERFVPTYIQAIKAPHIGYTRYLKCPKCNKRSWAKKVMSKNKKLEEK